jgi:hypothetical protein
MKILKTTIPYDTVLRNYFSTHLLIMEGVEVGDTMFSNNVEYLILDDGEVGNYVRICPKRLIIIFEMNFKRDVADFRCIDETNGIFTYVATR